jgi:hypothetical protein
MIVLLYLNCDLLQCQLLFVFGARRLSLTQSSASREIVGQNNISDISSHARTHTTNHYSFWASSFAMTASKAFFTSAI